MSEPLCSERVHPDPSLFARQSACQQVAACQLVRITGIDTLARITC